MARGLGEFAGSTATLVLIRRAAEGGRLRFFSQTFIAGHGAGGWLTAALPRALRRRLPQSLRLVRNDKPDESTGEQRSDEIRRAGSPLPRFSGARG